MTDVHHCLPQAVPKNAHRVEFAVHNLTRVVADKRPLKTEDSSSTSAVLVLP
jgi:hypothetical protein